MSEKIRVLIVDDSPSARVMLRRVVESDPALVVMGSVGDAFAAARQMKVSLPDVLLLDIEMPGMDGITFLRKVMAQNPLPVVICSSLGTRGSMATITALEAGAIDVILKPTAQALANPETAQAICDSLQGAARSTRNRRASRLEAREQQPLVSTRYSVDEILPPGGARALANGEPIVCIGASTGGTEALREVLTALPADVPPIAVVQHMPAGFTAAFAKRLNGLSAVEILEAEEGMALRPGRVLIAPGDRHLAIRRVSGGYIAQLLDGVPVNRHRPSVDVLFRSAAIHAGASALGVLMTGMGDDGARCLGEMRQAGAHTIAQDEATSVVWGMPREAVRLGTAAQVLPLGRIAANVMTHGKGKRGLVAK